MNIVSFLISAMMPVPDPAPDPSSCRAFISPWFPQIGQLLSPLSFIALTLLNSTSQSDCRLFLSLGLLDVLLWLHWGCVLGEEHHKVTYASQCIMLGDASCQYVLLLVMLTLKTWWRCCLPGLPIVKLQFFHFVINAFYLWGDAFRSFCQTF